MAAANYEGKAFRDGEHWHDGCGLSLPDAEGGLGHYAHAIVGDGPVRVGVRKTTPVLFRQRRDGGWDAEPLRGRCTVSPAGMVSAVVAVGITTPAGGPGVAVLIDLAGVVWTAVGAYEAVDDWCEETQ